MTFRWGKQGSRTPATVPEVSSLRAHWDPTIRKVQAGTDHTAPKRPMGRFLICPLLTTGLWLQLLLGQVILEEAMTRTYGHQPQSCLGATK